MLKIILILIIISINVSALSITEVMYDPDNKDEGKEFIEFTFNTNETPYFINTSRGLKELTLKNKGNNIGIILDESNNLQIKEDISIFTTQLSLKNKEDFIEIYNKDNILLDKISYNQTTKKSKSLCVDKSLFYCNSSPGIIYKLNNNENLIKGKEGIIYISKSLKAKKYAIYLFIIGLLILLLDYWLKKWKNVNTK